jgi:Big-like domain-containing protein
VTFGIPTLASAQYRPAHGTLGSVTGSRVSYTPEPGFAGRDGFLYQVTDAAGQRAAGIVIITVEGTSNAHERDSSGASSGVRGRLPLTGASLPAQLAAAVLLSVTGGHLVAATSRRRRLRSD